MKEQKNTENLKFEILAMLESSNLYNFDPGSRNERGAAEAIFELRKLLNQKGACRSQLLALCSRPKQPSLGAVHPSILLFCTPCHHVPTPPIRPWAHPFHPVSQQAVPLLQGRQRAAPSTIIPAHNFFNSRKYLQDNLIIVGFMIKIHKAQVSIQ